MPDGFTQPHTPAHMRVRSALTNRIEGEMKMCLGTMIVQVRCLLPFGPRALPRLGNNIFFFATRTANNRLFPAIFHLQPKKKREWCSQNTLVFPKLGTSLRFLLLRRISKVSVRWWEGEGKGQPWEWDPVLSRKATQRRQQAGWSRRRQLQQHSTSAIPTHPLFMSAPMRPQLDACKVCSQPKTI